MGPHFDIPLALKKKGQAKGEIPIRLPAFCFSVTVAFGAVC
jgi:hypothetical protein